MGVAAHRGRHGDGSPRPVPRQGPGVFVRHADQQRGGGPRHGPAVRRCGQPPLPAGRRPGEGVQLRNGAQTRQPAVHAADQRKILRGRPGHAQPQQAAAAPPGQEPAGGVWQPVQGPLLTQEPERREERNLLQQQQGREVVRGKRRRERLRRGSDVILQERQRKPHGFPGEQEAEAPPTPPCLPELNLNITTIMSK